MTTPDDTLLNDVRAEIEAVHRFIAGWFRGDEPAGAQQFHAGLAARLAPGFVNIQPAGRALTGETLLSAIERGHGTNPRFEIEIRDVQLRFVGADGGLVLATYTELQRGAMHSTPAENARVSTVLLQRTETGFAWHHIHETACPMPTG